MEMTGSHRIAAPRETVWRGLNDPDVLRQSIPGCEEVTKVSDTEFTARLVAKVGPVKAAFSGRVTLSDLDPPRGYTISGEGQSGVAGFGKGGASVILEEDGPESTVLNYTAQARVGGKLAQVGSRLVDQAARKMADDFFARFSDLVASPAETAEPAGPEVAGAEIAVPEIPAPIPSPAPPVPGEGRGHPGLWIVVAVVAGAAAVYFLFQ
ncbi:MAG TPA: carbon monoxide dehydrogenase subunit G [Azospirillaceae bacterium]|nr:carbon monoxide dehydrogenase subunit G [Azospirillaceae bacterium]